LRVDRKKDAGKGRDHRKSKEEVRHHRGGEIGRNPIMGSGKTPRLDRGTRNPPFLYLDDEKGQSAEMGYNVLTENTL